MSAMRPHTERCAHCGYPFDAHRDFDGACPTCEDDAATYLRENVDDQLPEVIVLSTEEIETIDRMLSNPGALFQVMHAAGDIERVWPVPTCCERHTVFAQRVSYALGASICSN